MLQMAGIEFIDTRIERSDWSNRKKEFEDICLGTLPILKIDNEIYCQQKAIENWAAMQAGIIPEDPEKQMRISMIYQTVDEVFFGAFSASMATVVAKCGPMDPTAKFTYSSPGLGYI